MHARRTKGGRLLWAVLASATLLACGQPVSSNGGFQAVPTDASTGAADGAPRAADSDTAEDDAASDDSSADSGRAAVDVPMRSGSDAMAGGTDVPIVGPDGAADSGTADAAVADGALMDGAATDGAPSDGTVSDGAVADGTVSDAVADGVWADTALADTALTDAALTDNVGAAKDVDAKADSADGKADTAPTWEAGPCKKEGAESCGKPLGVDPQSLYVCKTGKWTWHQTCQKLCEGMPDGVPDRCTDDLDVPASLVKTLDITPYVEQSCTTTTHPDWPFAAKKCTYTLGGKTATVVTATPSADKVAAWIVDSAVFIPALWSLRYIDPVSYKQGLQKIAVAVLGQSSRIFPIEGGILENMTGTAWVNYPFYHGVTDGCSTGCYCRINSLKREQWCAYKAFVSTQSEAECMAKVGYAGLTKGWGDQCLQNHIDAWKSTVNQHFRAKARYVHKAVAAQCATSVACSPSKILSILDKEL